MIYDTKSSSNIFNTVKKKQYVKISKLNNTIVEFNPYLNNSYTFKKRTDKNENLLLIFIANKTVGLPLYEIKAKNPRDIKIEIIFIIIKGSNNEIISVKEMRGIISSVYPQILNFLNEYSLYIYIGIYSDLIGEVLNPDSMDNLNFIKNNLLEYLINKRYFESVNYLNQFSIKYEAPLIYVIFSDSEQEKEVEGETKDKKEIEEKNEENKREKRNIVRTAPINNNTNKNTYDNEETLLIINNVFFTICVIIICFILGNIHQINMTYDGNVFSEGENKSIDYLTLKRKIKNKKDKLKKSEANKNRIKFKNIINKILIIIDIIPILSNKWRYIEYKSSKITLKIRGKGVKYILGYDPPSNNFDSKYFPNEVYINGALQNEVTYSYNFNQIDNYVDLIWNNDIVNCKNMFRRCQDSIEFDFSSFDTSQVNNMW